jgi:hypothetical protein
MATATRPSRTPAEAASVASDDATRTPSVTYGACGVEGCTRCRPLYDEANEPIPGTEDPDV